MSLALLFTSMILQQAPLQGGVSVGIGNTYAGAGVQLEAGAGPVSVGLGFSAALLPSRTPAAAAVLKLDAGRGWYAFASGSGWFDHPVPTVVRPGAAAEPDRWLTFSAGVGLRRVWPNGLFADVAVGIPYTMTRVWRDPAEWDFPGAAPRAVTWSERLLAPVPGVDPFYAPDFNASVGFAFGERGAHGGPGPTPFGAAAAMGAAMDALSFGLLFAAFNLTEAGMAIPLAPVFVVGGAAMLLRPFLTSLVASLAAGRPWRVLSSQTLLALLSDVVGAALILFSGRLLPSQPFVLFAGAVGFAVRSVVTPHAASHFPSQVPVVALRF